MGDSQFALVSAYILDPGARIKRYFAPAGAKPGPAAGDPVCEKPLDVPWEIPLGFHAAWAGLAWRMHGSVRELFGLEVR